VRRGEQSRFDFLFFVRRQPAGWAIMRVMRRRPERSGRAILQRLRKAAQWLKTRINALDFRDNPLRLNFFV
jgi:hypothetical protein